MTTPSRELQQPFTYSPAHRTPGAEAARGSADSAGFRADIEGLRGVAVLAVVAYHAGIVGARGGFVGVDVFFVISGYLITGLLLKERDRRGSIDLGRFVARRVRRLLPAALVMLLVTIGVSTLFLAPAEQVTLGRTARATAAYLTNAHFLLGASDYFAASNETNPLLHTWSLAVEEQFYLVWPLMLLALTSGRFLSRRALTWVIGALGVVSFVGCVLYTRRNASLAFYGTPLRAWEFAAGAVATMLAAPASLRARWVASTVGLAAILASVELYSTNTAFPGYAAALPVLGTAVLLWAGAGGQSRATEFFLARRPLLVVGRLSYSWYLWHWPVLVFGLIALPGLGQGGRLALAAASLGLAALSYAFVERPLRHSRTLTSRPRYAVAFALASTTVALLCAQTLLRRASATMRLPDEQRVTAALTLPRVYDEGCVSATPDAEPQTCVYGDATGASTVVLFGDSHAAQWFPALEQIARRRHWRLVTLLKSSCPAADVNVRTSHGEVFPTCPKWRARAIGRLASLDPRLVVLSSARVYVDDTTRTPVEQDHAITAAEWGDGYRRTFARVAALGRPVAVIQDAPIAGFDVPTCLSRPAPFWTSRVRQCDPARATSVPDAVVGAERAAARGMPSVAAIDLTSHFCSATACPSVRDGMVVYRDPNHITVAYATSLAGVIEAQLDSLAPSLGAGVVSEPTAAH